MSEFWSSKLLLCNLLNCIFDCQYCFLQGMYNSSNIVCFVNVEDFAKEFSRMECGSMIALSYETDLIAHHNIVPYLEYIYEYIKATENVALK